jgi:hypothetical protein
LKGIKDFIEKYYKEVNPNGTMTMADPRQCKKLENYVMIRNKKPADQAEFSSKWENGMLSPNVKNSIDTGSHL